MRIAKRWATIRHSAVRAVWLAALLFAVANGLFVLRRAPIVRTESATPDERAAQAVAASLRRAPVGSRALLVRSHHDIGAVWFGYRLNYLVYPIRIDSAWETVPQGAVDRYDLLIALGAARGAIPPKLPTIAQTDFVTLFASPSYRADALQRPESGALSPAAAAFGGAALIVVPLLGALLIGATVRRAQFRDWWANLALAHLIGSAALTWVGTLGGLFGGRLAAWPIYLLPALLLPFGRRVWRCIVPSRDGVERSPSGARETNLRERAEQALPLLLIGLGALMTATIAVMLGVGWDGYSIWQLKALAFIQDGSLSLLRDSHYALYSHPDYPLLVPMQTWWCGVHAGGYCEAFAQINGALFALDLFAIFASAALEHLPRRQMMMGLGLLASLPVLCTHAVSGFADIEMACLLLTMGVMLSRLWQSQSAIPTNIPDVSGPATLCWIGAALALTKNEGLLAAINAALICFATCRRGRAGAAVVLSSAASILPWALAKRSWRLSSDLMDRAGGNRYTVAMVLSRLLKGLAGFAMELAKTGPRAGGWGLLVLLVPIGAWRSTRRGVSQLLPLWLLCGAQLGGYLLIYTITFWPIEQHIGSSVDRLTLHLAPCLLLGALVGTFGKPKGSADRSDAD